MTSLATVSNFVDEQSLWDVEGAVLVVMGKPCLAPFLCGVQFRRSLDFKDLAMAVENCGSVVVVSGHCVVGGLIVIFGFVRSVAKWVVDGCLVTFDGLGCKGNGFLSLDWQLSLDVVVVRQDDVPPGLLVVLFEMPLR